MDMKSDITVSDPSDPDMSDATLCCLPADLGIEQLAALREQLVATDGASLRFDARQVSRVHSASLQLLAAYCRDRRTAGLDTHWADASETLRDAARRLDLTTTLQLQEH